MVGDVAFSVFALIFSGHWLATVHRESGAIGKLSAALTVSFPNSITFPYGESLPGGGMKISLKMSTKYIISSLIGTGVLVYFIDYMIAEKKVFGGTTPKTVADNEWFEETDKKFQKWPRTAGPPVVINPISRQNFIVKTRPEA